MLIYSFNEWIDDEITWDKKSKEEKTEVGSTEWERWIEQEYNMYKIYAYIYIYVYMRGREEERHHKVCASPYAIDLSPT